MELFWIIIISVIILFIFFFSFAVTIVFCCHNLPSKKKSTTMIYEPTQTYSPTYGPVVTIHPQQQPSAPPLSSTPYPFHQPVLYGKGFSHS
jgi:hypothetical protein